MNTKPITLVSVRLPPELVSKIDERAREECRSRNSQIEFLLRTSVDCPPARRHQEEHA